MSTFESLDKSKLVNYKGLGYLDFRKTLTPKYWLAWTQIFIGYLTLVLVLSAIFAAQKRMGSLFWLTIPVGGIFIGYIISALHLFIHEASHYHLAPDKKKNDLLATIFIGILVGMETNFYRSVHFAHHKLIGSKEDTEKSYFNGLRIKFLLESLTGLTIIKVIPHRNKNIKLNYGTASGKEIIRKNNLVFFISVILNALLVVIFFVKGYWQPALAWMFGIGIMFPFFAMFRQILEHRRPEAQFSINYNTTDQGASHRMFGDGPIGSTLGAAGFNRHLIHHWDPYISCTRLKDVEQFLMETELRDELERSQTTYFKTFKILLNK